MKEEKEVKDMFEPDYIIDNKFKIIKKIGEGSFGNVYKAIVLATNELIAVKVEKIEKTNSRLKMEYNIYKQIEGEGIPSIQYYNDSYHHYKILIMTFLGPSLEDLFQFCSCKFTVKTIAMIAIQILDRLEHIHKNNIIHRDIKPENFVIGVGKNKSMVYLVDFGLSKAYCEKEEHIEFKNNKNFTGTYRYSSIRNHRGIEQSRRDDLESIGYMLIYLYHGGLPWQGIKVANKAERNRCIYKKKRTVSIEEIVGELPDEFCQYLRYCRLLRFTQHPDYNYLRSLFYEILYKNNNNIDNIYDWNIVAKTQRNSLKSKEN